MRVFGGDICADRPCCVGMGMVEVGTPGRIINGDSFPFSNCFRRSAPHPGNVPGPLTVDARQIEPHPLVGCVSIRPLSPPADDHPRRRPQRCLHDPDRGRPWHRCLRLEGTSGRVGRALPRQQRERRQAPQGGISPGFQDPSRRARRMRPRRCGNQGMPVPGSAPEPCRPAWLQARQRRGRAQDVAHHPCRAQDRQAVLRLHRRLRGTAGQAQRSAVDSHALPLRLRHAERRTATQGGLNARPLDRPVRRNDFGPRRGSPPVGPSIRNWCRNRPCTMTSLRETFVPVPGIFHDKTMTRVLRFA